MGIKLPPPPPPPLLNPQYYVVYLFQQSNPLGHAKKLLYCCQMLNHASFKTAKRVNSSAAYNTVSFKRVARVKNLFVQKFVRTRVNGVQVFVQCFLFLLGRSEVSIPRLIISHLANHRARKTPYACLVLDFLEVLRFLFPALVENI